MDSNDLLKNIDNYSLLKKICGGQLAMTTVKSIHYDEYARQVVRFMRGQEMAVVLGGGGAKTAAHFGVLDVLESEGITIDLTAGSSSGSIPAALWADGLSPAQAAEVYLKDFVARNPKVPDWTWPGRGYLAAGRPGKNFLLRCFGERRTFDLLRAFLPVAVDMKRGIDVVVSGCEIWRSIFASQAIPGLFPLQEHDDMLLADGALANNVPSSRTREYGARLVLGVNISPTPDMTPFDHRSLSASILRSAEVMMHQTTKRHRQYSDLEIRPRIGQYGMFDFKQSERFIDLGREAAQEKLPEIRYLLKEKKSHHHPV